MTLSMYLMQWNIKGFLTVQPQHITREPPLEPLEQFIWETASTREGTSLPLIVEREMLQVRVKLSCKYSLFDRS